MINYKDLFNSFTFNIFTDASIYHNKSTGETIGSPGAIIVFGNNIIDERKEILRYSTNNESEITAIRLGLELVLKYKDILPKANINLFSDSLISVMGLREWIFSWIKNSNNGILYNSSNKLVANQSIFLEIIYMILNYDIRLSIYHIKGHTSITPKNMEAFISIFRNNNYISDNLSFDLVKALIYYNDYIDKSTRLVFNDLENLISNNPPLSYPIKYRYDNMDIRHYKELLNINTATLN